MENCNNLDIEDFFVELWEQIPNSVVSEGYKNEYVDYINILTRDLYIQYISGVSFEVIKSLTLIFFHNMFVNHNSNVDYFKR